jgi:hypothetical protein
MVDFRFLSRYYTVTSLPKRLSDPDFKKALIPADQHAQISPGKASASDSNQ